MKILSKVHAPGILGNPTRRALKRFTYPIELHWNLIGLVFPFFCTIYAMKYHTNKATASILQYRHPVIENAKANLNTRLLTLSIVLHHHFIAIITNWLLGQFRPAPPPSSVHDPIETDNKINIHKPKAPTNSDIIPPFLLIVLHTVVDHKDRYTRWYPFQVRGQQ